MIYISFELYHNSSESVNNELSSRHSNVVYISLKYVHAIATLHWTQYPHLLLYKIMRCGVYRSIHIWIIFVLSQWSLGNVVVTDFENVISNLQSLTHFTDYVNGTCEIALSWMPQHTFDDKSTLVPIMGSCRQTTCHELCQRWARFPHMASLGHTVLTKCSVYRITVS